MILELDYIVDVRNIKEMERSKLSVKQKAEYDDGSI